MAEEKRSSSSSSTEKLPKQEEDQENPALGQEITATQSDQVTNMTTDQSDKPKADDDEDDDKKVIVEKEEGDGSGGKGDQEMMMMMKNSIAVETVAAAGGVVGSSGVKKRGRSNSESGEGPSTDGGNGQSKQRKKGELELPNREPICYVCDKTFGSWKALFGHMRAHPSRVSPGVFPPPIFTPQGSPERVRVNAAIDENATDVDQQLALREQLAPTLLNLARQTMERLSKQQQDENLNSDASTNLTAPTLRRGLDIDLNFPTILLDLNEPPPPEKDDDDDGLNHNNDDIDNAKN